MPRVKSIAWPINWVMLGVLFVVCTTAPAADDDTTRAIAALRLVDREGKSNDAAGLAWKALVKQGGPALMPALKAIDDSNPTAANWLRTAVDAIADTERAAGRPLPVEQLEKFTTDTGNAPSARRLAYELLISQDKTAAERLLPGFLNDASPELRRDAITAELAKLEKSPPPSIKSDLENLFRLARDVDQIELIARKLQTEYKTNVSVTRHLAFVTHWAVVGPFESKQGMALSMSYPPESAKDLAGKFKGKDATEVSWKNLNTADKYGKLDLNKTLGKFKNSSAYCLATIVAEKETPCEVRVGTKNAIQIFLNGKKLFEREEYHHGANMDYHIGKGTLKAGENTLLLKVCQNDQNEPWAQDWFFQARVCDSTGGSLAGVTQLIPDGSNSKSIPLGFIPEILEPKEEKK